MIQGNAWSNDEYNWSWTSHQYDPVTEEWYYQDEYAYWQILNQPASGTLNALAEGYFEFTPDENSTLPSDAFTYQICDDSSCASATVTLQFNQTPVANLDEFSVAMGGSLSVLAAAGVLTNDTDADDQSLGAVLVTTTSHGTLTLDADGGFTYAPDSNFAGWDSFTYLADDGYDESEAATVWIKVNAPPVAYGNSYSLAQYESLNWPEPSVLANDTDENGDALTAIVETQPVHGTLTLDEGGFILYTPTFGFSGTDSFTYRASDGSLTSDPATVSLTVLPIDPNLVATDDFSTTIAGQPIVISSPGLLGNDSASGGTPTAQLLSYPAYGTLDLHADGGFTYTPTTPLFTTDSFTTASPAAKPSASRPPSRSRTCPSRRSPSRGSSPTAMTGKSNTPSWAILAAASTSPSMLRPMAKRWKSSWSWPKT